MPIPVTLLMSLNDRSTGGPYMFKSEGVQTCPQIAKSNEIDHVTCKSNSTVLNVNTQFPSDEIPK